MGVAVAADNEFELTINNYSLSFGKEDIGSTWASGLLTYESIISQPQTPVNLPDPEYEGQIYIHYDYINNSYTLTPETGSIIEFTELTSGTAEEVLNPSLYLTYQLQEIYYYVRGKENSNTIDEEEYDALTEQEKADYEYNGDGTYTRTEIVGILSKEEYEKLAAAGSPKVEGYIFNPATEQYEKYQTIEDIPEDEYQEGDSYNGDGTYTKSWIEYYWSDGEAGEIINAMIEWSPTSSTTTVYTHPGDCTTWSDLISGDRKKSELIKVNEVEAWLIHYKKWLSWKQQGSYYDDDMSDYTPNVGDLITANWYNKMANLVDISTVNSGDQIKASHFTALSNAIS